jgi:hypothetical protein
MDWFLLNSNKRCESENKEGISSTSGKSVKKRENRKYDDSYLDFGFTLAEVDGKERPQYVVRMKVLASGCMHIGYLWESQKGLLGRPRCRLVYNFKMDLRGTR